ncbi:MAG: GerMN domain-containing protein, partial [Defluviitaleaceae bacterium]|nr:GerMN domain-containing protein [Defluviitaleaceae bacterium]
MKKNLLKITTAMLCLALISGCGLGRRETAPEPEPPADPAGTAEPAPVYSVADYFPFLENTTLRYTDADVDSVFWERFMLYTDASGVQMLSSGSNFRTTDVFRIEDGALKNLAGSNRYSYDNILDVPNMRHITVLQEPLELGHTWEYIRNGVEAEITGINKKVVVPYGEFEALQVTIRHGENDTQWDYFARGVGLIRRSRSVDGEEMSMNLVDVIRGAPKTIEVDICKVNTTTDRLEWERCPFELTTNMDMVEYWNALLKTPLPIDYQPLLPGESGILSFSLDRVEQLLTVDLSEDYIGNIGAGAGIESAALQALANTLGNFHAASHV